MVPLLDPLGNIIAHSSLLCHFDLRATDAPYVKIPLDVQTVKDSMNSTTIGYGNGSTSGGLEGTTSSEVQIEPPESASFFCGAVDRRACC